MAEIKLDLDTKATLDDLRRSVEELNYLRYFHADCDFGTAHEDIIVTINCGYESETGNEAPEGY